MSKRHPIDELFSQGLANSSASVPEDMWARIAKNRKKKARRTILAWTALSSLAIGLCVLAWWTINDAPTVGFFPVQSAANTQQPLASVVETEGQAAKLTTTTSAIATEQAADRGTATAKRSKFSPLSPLETRTTQASRTNGTPTKLVAVTNGTSNDAGLWETVVENAETSPSLTGSNTDSETSHLTEEEKENSRVAGPHQRVRMGSVAALPSKIFKLSEQTDIKLFANHAPRCADFSSPFFHFDAELLGGPAYASQMLKAKTDGSLEHLQQRETSETASISYATSLRLAATSNTGLGLRSGFSYTQINEQFTHQVGSKIDVAIIFGPNGQVIGRDTTYTEAYNEKSSNRLKFVEIPLLLSYEKKVGKLRIGLNAGAYLNLFFDAKGTVFSPATNEPIAFGQEGDRNRLPIFERRATAAWYGGMSFAYNLHSRYSLLAEPYFKTYPRALSSTGYDLAQNYWMTGLQVGLRMRL